MAKLTADEAADRYAKSVEKHNYPTKPGTEKYATDTSDYEKPTRVEAAREQVRQQSKPSTFSRVLDSVFGSNAPRRETASRQVTHKPTYKYKKVGNDYIRVSTKPKKRYTKPQGGGPMDLFSDSGTGGPMTLFGGTSKKKGRGPSPEDLFR